MSALPKSKPNPSVVLTKATLNAAQLLGLNHTELAKVLGTSPASISRLSASARLIDPESQEGKFSVMLVKIFKNLDLMVGGDATARNTWMNAHNKVLGCTPKQSIQTIEGIVYTLNYLNGMKGSV